MKNSCAPSESNFFASSWKTVISKVGPAPPEYIALPLRNLACGQQVPFEVLVRTSPTGPAAGQFQTCCTPGQAFEPDWLAKLQEAGVDRVYYRQGDQDLVFTYLNQHLPAVLNDDSLPIKDKAERVADVTYLWLNQFFTSTQTPAVPQLQQGFAYVDHLLQCFSQDHYHRHWMLDLCRYDQNLYSHCLSTSLLSMAFARHLGWQEPKIRELGRGALLHDIGMTRVPAALLNKKGKLSDDEYDLVKRHPYSGYVLLKTLSVMKRETLFLILQHHENGDGSGYPDGLKMARIHLFARVMRIIDSFDALVSPRSWRQGHPPAEALWIMRQDWQQKGLFDAVLLVEFIKFIAGGHQEEKTGSSAAAGKLPRL